MRMDVCERTGLVAALVAGSIRAHVCKSCIIGKRWWHCLLLSHATRRALPCNSGLRSTFAVWPLNTLTQVHVTTFSQRTHASMLHIIGQTACKQVHTAESPL